VKPVGSKPREIELALGLDEPESRLRDLAASRLALRPESISIRILKRSLDARKGRAPVLRYRLEVSDASADAAANANADAVSAPAGREPTLPQRSIARASDTARRVVIVGSGPAGSFAALRLAEAGLHVTVIERGKPVQPRRRDLAELTRGHLDPDSNYCFGEGGAGTFSDGKLYTRTKDRAGVDDVLRTLVRFGASPDITFDARPHIGSNKLPKVLLALRAHLEACGVAYVWSDPMVDLLIAQGRVRGVRLRSGAEHPADAVVLAVGHSARDVYELAASIGIAGEPKAFAVGARVEHPQPLIDEIQYGAYARHPRLPAAFYHVTAQIGARGVYSFCMCPGGWIVPSATETGGLVTNGMSLSRRDSPFANAALVVTVEPRDFGAAAGGNDLLAGVEFQRRIERAAFELGGGDFRAPATRLDDFAAQRASRDVPPTSYQPGAVPADVARALPESVANALRGALADWRSRMPAFYTHEAALIGVETRTSAPVRLVRDAETLESPSHGGLYPAGEGAGYAGGIVSAALDGLRVAERIAGRFAG
jgi:uncharacterized FAD-dependent dehydrogenase